MAQNYVPASPELIEEVQHMLSEVLQECVTWPAKGTHVRSSSQPIPHSMLFCRRFGPTGTIESVLLSLVVNLLDGNWAPGLLALRKVLVEGSHFLI